jgi:uncharacterized protein (TIGR00369 family)
VHRGRSGAAAALLSGYNPDRRSRVLDVPATIVEFIKKRFAEAVPHNRALGVRLVELSGDEVVSELPYDPKLVGNPEAGFLHGGAITSLIDATCGMAVPIKMMRPVPIATLDLRIDYLKPPAPGKSVLCRAVCYKTTRNVAFVRATADCGDRDDPVAAAAGTFIIFGDEGKGA